MKEIYAILSIKIVFSIIGLLLHGVGIYTLKRNKWNNQVIILINLSTAEIILLINFIIEDSMGFMEQSNENNTNVIINGMVGSKTLPENYKQIYIFILYIGGFEMEFLLMILTVERLICILSPLHYHIIVEEKLIIQKIVLCSWGFSIMLSLFAFFPNTNIVAERFGIITQITVVILFLISYILIGIKIKKSKSSLQSTANTSQTGESTCIKKHHLVPVAIIFTYIIFYVIPWQIIVFYIDNLQSTMKIRILFEIIQLFIIIGCLSDAFIYIFLTKGNRDIIVKLLGC